MMIITTIALLFISILSLNYFSSVYVHDAKSKARYTLEVASSAFYNHIDTILRSTSKFAGSKTVVDTLKDILNHNEDQFVSNYIEMQSYLDRLIDSDVLIDDVLIIGKHKEFFAPTKYGLNYDVSNYFNWNIKQIDKITLLSSRRNPLSNLENVIPVIIPISNIGTGETLSPMISGSVKNSLATIIILLNVDKINENFKELNENADSTLYVTNENGNSLNLDESSNFYSAATSNDVIKQVRATTEEINEFEKSFHKDILMIASDNVNYCGLKVVSIVSKQKMLSGISTIKSFIFFAWALSFLLTVVLSFIISQFITNPIVKLIGITKKIENGNYSPKVENKYNDEIGSLISSINSMYDTIQLQMELIKQEEQDKANSEIKLLTEQINPHFIYNTLDCIRWEILGQNTKSSAAMVESLGQLLRISLNYGNSLIPIHQELQHVTEYINIINLRSNKRITYRQSIDPQLTNHRITKLILQPLVENSILHGFGDEPAGIAVLSPVIEINIRLNDENRLLLKVTDNGKGIDIDRANQALYQLDLQSSKATVGLHNVYRRLRLYYGNSVNIYFLTTPYYENSVIVDLPYQVEPPSLQKSPP